MPKYSVQFNPRLQRQLDVHAYSQGQQAGRPAAPGEIPGAGEAAQGKPLSLSALR